MSKAFLTLLFSASLLGIGQAQSLREQYASKAAACADGSYRNTVGYRSYGQIGWEAASGWRPIKYLERFESEHRTYPVNMMLYLQVLRGGEVVDDCEVVAWDSKGNVVGDQCPEPLPQTSQDLTDLAIMSLFGSTNEVIHFTVVTGTTTASLQEAEVAQTVTFRANTAIGLVDTDGDGEEDSIEPLQLVLPGYWLGDMDGNDLITLADVTALIDLIVHRGYDKRGDMDGSGTLTAQDVQLLANILLDKAPRQWVNQ